MRIECEKEIHSTGGQGLYILNKAETALDDLIARYEGKIQLIYLDLRNRRHVFRSSS